MAKNAALISELTPTRLISPEERPPVPAAKIRRGSRYLFVLKQLTGLFIGNAFLKLRGKSTAAKREDRTVRTLQRLGMLWIRAAQALLLRGSSLSTPFGMHLMDLRDKGGAHDFPRIREIIETELGRPIHEVFDKFEEKPFASTMVSQTHRARLRDEQIWTAVKVQQPGAEDIFHRDLKLFRRIIGLLKFFSIRTGMRWDELCHELNQIKDQELNYYYEAAALETLDKNLKRQPVCVPKVFRRYCRQRVLVMEFLQGALLSDIVAMLKTDPQRLDAWLKSNNIDLGKVARRLFHSTYRQVFEDNFFHGDMHTGNIILMRDSHIAVIECRSAGSLELESLEKQKVYLRKLAEQEYVTAAEIYFLLASRLPRVDLNTVKDRLIRVWRVWEMRTYIKDLPYQQKSLAYMTGQVNRVVHDNQFAPLWSFVKVTCTWVHLDNSLAVLAPEMNYIKHLRLYFRNAARRDSIDKLMRLPSRLTSAFNALNQVPKRTEEYTLFKETLLRRQAQVVQGSASKLDSVVVAGFSFISLLVLIVAGFLASVFGIRHLDIPLEPLLGPQLTSLAKVLPDMSPVALLMLFTVFISLYVFFRIQKKRFGCQEFGRGDNPNAMET